MKKDWMVRESELDDTQIRVLMATLDKSIVVKGCAGSGKSVLALIKAQRVPKERSSNYSVIVFTKALCAYMNSGRQELGLKKEFTYYWDWKNRQGCPKADYIIVDEIQDFTETEIREFINAAQKNFYFFGDTAQSLYNGLDGKITMPVENIAHDLCVNMRRPIEFDLYNNYRLPLPIAKFVQYVGVDLQAFDAIAYKSKANKMPCMLSCSNKEEQLKSIKHLVSNGSEDVAVLLPHNDMVKDVGYQLNNLGMNVEMRYNDRVDWRNSKDTLNFNSSNPKVMTYHSAKGLQFEHVFLPYLEDFNDSSEAARKALYVAMTRTYDKLHILYSGNKPTVLSQIPTNYYETGEKQKVEDL